MYNLAVLVGSLGRTRKCFVLPVGIARQKPVQLLCKKQVAPH